MKFSPWDTKNMKRESKPGGHSGNKASGTEEIAGKYYKIRILKHGVYV